MSFDDYEALYGWVLYTNAAVDCDFNPSLMTLRHGRMSVEIGNTIPFIDDLKFLANHIYQKHRLAVALAVIKSKPANVDTGKYLEDLKAKVDDKMDEDVITVCSDDFLIDDDDDMNDSVTILKDFDIGNDEINQAENTKTSLTLANDLSQTTYYDSSQTQYTPNIIDYSDYHNVISEDHSRNHSSDKAQPIPKNIDYINTESNVNIRNTDQNAIFNNKTNSNVLCLEEPHTASKDCNHNANMDSTYYDSQKTVLYTVHGFTDNYTHCSPSQSDIIIPNKYIYGKNKNQIHTVQNKDNNEVKNTFTSGTKTITNSSQNINEFSNETQFIRKRNITDNISNTKTNETQSNNVEIEYSQTMNMFSQINEDYNAHLNIENDTTAMNNRKTNLDSLNRKPPEHSKNIDEYFEDIQYVDENGITNNKNLIHENNLTRSTNMEITEAANFYSKNTYNYFESLNNIESKNECDIEKKILDSNRPIYDDRAKEDYKNQMTEINIQNSEKNDQVLTLTNKNDISDKPSEIREEEDCEPEELISYKVLEEFNKVKTFLKRQNRRISCDGYSTDSGYRSDTQIRSSNRSALQLSGNWLNQSGCCLFNYIMQCPLVASTRDITNEIAQVLSQLIDKLHEEEKYPSFLEDLLETVDVLLRQVHEGESSGDNEFLKKDESIQRFLLLNKSIHIQRHSIEKISNILQKFHSKITETDSTYELSNTEEMENLSYIFHILEILLKKYLKNKDLSSQSSTQPSQDEEKLFKKSSITDIWRKKWNPSQKVFEGSREKKCVLKICSDVLNKIVVDCVSSYSLVAYSALKCFNSLQS